MIAHFYRIGARWRRAARSARLLARVLIVALRGLYRSWRIQGPTAHPAFRRHRHAAYRQLWAKLEDVYWKLRESNSDRMALCALLRDVDSFLANNSLYIREADQALFTHYILSLYRLGGAIARMNQNDSAAARDSDGAPTANTFATISGLTEDAVDLRNRVLRRLGHTLPAN